MAKRRNYKRNGKGQFVSAASRSARVKHAVPSKVVSGSRKINAGRVGPGGQYAEVTAGVELKPRKGSARYYVGVSAGRRISY